MIIPDLPPAPACLDAGEFGAWLAQTEATLRGEAAADVPCGDCVGCCTSHYFIHVRPEDRAARGVIPAALLVPAPGWPEGHRLMGFAADGHCPMYRAGCTIYAQRPRTCRDYDCRIYAAAGIEAGRQDTAVINARVRAWTFSFADDHAHRAQRAVRAAADFVRRHAAAFPGGRVPTQPSDLAVLAIKVHRVFLREDLRDAKPATIARAVIEDSRSFGETA